jgi:RsmE family RNA methyltransferase
MRVIFYPSIEQDLNDLLKSDLKQFTLSIKGEDFHHLKNVLRIHPEEIIAFVDGKGFKIIGKILEVQVKAIIVLFTKSFKLSDFEKESSQQIFFEPKHNIHLVLGFPKMDTWEECLSIIPQLGFKSVINFRSDYSANSKHDFDKENLEKKQKRWNTILKNAIEQSRNPILPKLHFEKNLEAVWDHHFKSQKERIPELEKHYFFHPYIANKGILKNNPIPEKYLNQHKYADTKTFIWIGPEGGWSLKEIDFFQLKYGKQALWVKLDTGILRTKLCLATALGWVLGHDNF